jgi:CMP-N-acetylneuraminic acid synthetase
MKLVAMIPARLGSKRIPKKNLRYLDGVPLLLYPIDLAKKIDSISEIYVNSESKLLGKLGATKGADFHQRPEELGSDTATNQDFTKEFLEKHECDYVIMINPTSPLLSEKSLEDFVEMVLTGKFDTILSSIDEQAETFYEEKPLNFTFEEKINSQDLPITRKIVWALTAWRRSTFLKACSESKCGVFSGKVGVFGIPKDECCDLDTPEDWRIAEGFLAARKIKEKIKFWQLEG